MPATTEAAGQAPGPRPLGPDVVITDIHRIGEELGAQRLRIDRSGWGDPHQPDCWFEVGYASGEIHVRTSDPELRLRFRWEQPPELERISDLFVALLEKYRRPTW